MVRRDHARDLVVITDPAGPRRLAETSLEPPLGHYAGTQGTDRPPTSVLSLCGATLPACPLGPVSGSLACCTGRKHAVPTGASCPDGTGGLRYEASVAKQVIALLVPIVMIRYVLIMTDAKATSKTAAAETCAAKASGDRITQMRTYAATPSMVSEAKSDSKTFWRSVIARRCKQ